MSDGETIEEAIRHASGADLSQAGDTTDSQTAADPQTATDPQASDGNQTQAATDPQASDGNQTQPATDPQASDDSQTQPATDPQTKAAASQAQKNTVQQAIYVTDAEGNLVASIGDGSPVLDYSLSLNSSDEDEIFVYADSENAFFEEGGNNQILNLSFEQMMREVFSGDGASEMSAEGWMNQNLVEQKIWMQSPVEVEDYQIYVACTLQIERSDLFNICVIALIALALLLIPLTFLFVNTITTILMQRRVTTLLFMDHVTGGKNWLYFKDFAEKHLYTLRNSQKPYALVNLQVERYRNYCACYGVAQGEDLLESLDGFLNARMQKKEAFVRHSNADFALLIQCQGSNEEECEAYCRTRLRSLLAELTGLRSDRKIRFHAGVYLIPPAVPKQGRKLAIRERLDIDQTFNYANSALEKAHDADSAQVSFFNQELLKEQNWEHFVEDNMERALTNDEFCVYLQAKYNPTDNRLVGAEALIRWQHPTEGLLPPGRFIPIFEENGFITKIDDFMISSVAKILAEWKISGKKQIPISVNVSRAHFAQEGLAKHIEELVDAYGPEHGLLELEVTESAFFDDKDILVATVKELKERGFRVSMDDFGAGYSSLNSLKDIPLDVLKLDREFFRGDDTDGRGKVVVCEAIRLARNLNMHIVAEGIESKEQVDFLASQGCDMIQGFYFARPVPLTDFEKEVEENA